MKLINTNIIIVLVAVGQLARAQLRGLANESSVEDLPFEMEKEDEEESLLPVDGVDVGLVS